MVKTLIVDDSEAFRHSMRQLLASRFQYMRIAEAATVRDAVAEAYAMRPDLVFVDVRLPDGSGLGLAELLASNLPQSRVCVVTSFDLPEYRSAARASGAVHFLPKADSTSDQIAAVVEATLDQRVRMLVIEPDAARRGMICANVQMGWPAVMVFEAGDGRAGLAMASAVRPHMVLVRLSLLARARARLGHALKALDRASTLVAVGHAPRASHRAAALLAGADHAVAWREGMDAGVAAIIDGVVSPRDGARSRDAVSAE